MGLGRDPAIWLKSFNETQPSGSTFVPGPLPRTALLHTLLGCGAELCVEGGRWAKKVEAKIVSRSRKTVLFPSGWAWSEVEGGK